MNLSRRPGGSGPRLDHSGLPKRSLPSPRRSTPRSAVSGSGTFYSPSTPEPRAIRPTGASPCPGSVAPSRATLPDFRRRDQLPPIEKANSLLWGVPRPNHAIKTKPEPVLPADSIGAALQRTKVRYPPVIRQSPGKAPRMIGQNVRHQVNAMEVVVDRLSIAG